MNGPEHYAEAERLAARVLQVREEMAGKLEQTTTIEAIDRKVAEMIALAQVHATLALVAVQTATAFRAGALTVAEGSTWRRLDVLPGRRGEGS